MRGDRHKQKSLQKETERHASNEIEFIDVSDYKPRRIPPPLRRECIKKIWTVDPLEYPHCKTEMKTISFINERPVIRKILEHLNLWNDPRKQRPPPRAGPRCHGRNSIKDIPQLAFRWRLARVWWTVYDLRLTARTDWTNPSIYDDNSILWISALLKLIAGPRFPSSLQ